jgi:hypothetical protein
MLGTLFGQNVTLQTPQQADKYKAQMDMQRYGNGLHDLAAQNNALGMQNIALGGYGPQVGQIAEPLVNFDAPELELNLLECADMWETRFGDTWVDTRKLDAEYRTIKNRLGARDSGRWFENWEGRIRLVPKELRR